MYSKFVKLSHYDFFFLKSRVARMTLSVVEYCIFAAKLTSNIYNVTHSSRSKYAAIYV